MRFDMADVTKVGLGRGQPAFSDESLKVCVARRTAISKCYGAVADTLQASSRDIKGQNGRTMISTRFVGASKLKLGLSPRAMITL
ncbi:MAG: hypothetical protein J0M17_06840 [Planctomycetes bacterium]|nr:hypothetical protein [Planctomycetota bacterium]